MSILLCAIDELGYLKRKADAYGKMRVSISFDREEDRDSKVTLMKKYSASQPDRRKYQFKGPILPNVRLELLSGRHQPYFNGQKREMQRRMKQIAKGQLKSENGLEVK